MSESRILMNEQERQRQRVEEMFAVIKLYFEIQFYKMNIFLVSILVGVIAAAIFYIETRFVSKNEEILNRSNYMKFFTLGFVCSYLAVTLHGTELGKSFIGGVLATGSTVAMNTGVAPF